MRRFLTTAAAIAAAVAAATAPASTGPRAGGTIVAADAVGTTFDCVNIWFICGGTGPSIVYDVIEGAFKVGPDLSYRPNLVSRVAITSRPFAVTYFIRPQARWSDGVPVSSRDFLFTYRSLTNPRYRSAAAAWQSIYAPVRSVRIVGPKTLTVTFKAPDAAWRDLFHEVLPEHALSGQNLMQVWKDGIDDPRTGAPISDGPFVISSLVPGDHLTVIRNPRYWGAHTSYLDSILFRPASDSVSAIDQVESGAVDTASVQIEPQLVEAEKRHGLTVQSRAGTSYEQLQFRLGPGGSDLLRHLYVREALAYGIDRDDLVRRLFAGLDPTIDPLQNLVLFAGQRYYQPHWQVYRHDAAHARRLLVSNGCRLGPDGVYVCGGERLSFRFATTTGNPTRELTFSILHEQLARIGIELVPVFAHPSVFFGQIVSTGNFDIALFSYVNDPDPSSEVEDWSCGGDENEGGYCNRTVSAELRRSNTVLDPTSRAALLNRADAQMARDIPAIPLFEKPAFVVSTAKLHGVLVNDTEEGWLWNADDWWLSR